MDAGQGSTTVRGLDLNEVARRILELAELAAAEHMAALARSQAGALMRTEAQSGGESPAGLPRWR